MARRSREDEPGAWHHVMNRGIARRPLFEDRTDIRYFLSRLAYEVKAGRLEVHCWCIMTTHFHLLVRCPTGELSTAIRNLQNTYSRFFNRRHKRDGTLIRGRFTSNRVRSMAYRRLLIGYINRNPVDANLTALPQDYPFGSAYYWAKGRVPKWMSRDWVTAEFATTTTSTEACALVESRLQTPDNRVDDMDDLIGAAPSTIQAWMQRKAKLADGSPLGMAMCDRASVLAAIRLNQAGETAAHALAPPMTTSMQIGLLRTLARLPWKEIAEAFRFSTTKCTRHYTHHEERLNNNQHYALVAGLLAKAAFDRCHRSPSR